MEIIIGLIIVGLAGVLWYNSRKKAAAAEAALLAEITSAPYKVPEPVATAPIPLVINEAPKVEEIAAKAETVVETVKALAKPKAPAKPKAAPVKKAPVKKAPTITARPKASKKTPTKTATKK